jgi:telomere length regulation protein
MLVTAPSLTLYASGSSSFALSPHILPIFLKTLAFILQAAGPSTLALPQMTSEFWDLLLSLRGHASNDVNVMEALLFAMLVLLETNNDHRRLAREHSSSLLETQEWAKLVHDQTQSSGTEGERVAGLSAAVVVRAQEVVQQFRKDMLGDLADF